MLNFGLGGRSENNDPEVISTPPQNSMNTRPRIGIALGGGAARGWAHIGVMKTLHAAGFAPEIIAGSSMGSVVGGCYANNSLDKLEDFASSLTKRRIFGLMDFNFAGSGLISGNKVGDLIAENIGDDLIEDLALTYVSVATELDTGHEIWLAKGRLVDAMRASYAMPGIFKPFRVHGRWLVDGALVNPVPVSVCRAKGARLVIAVNLNTDFLGRGTVIHSHQDYDPKDNDQAQNNEAPDAKNGRAAKTLLRRQLVGPKKGPPGISRVMFDSYNIVQDRIARSRLAGDPPDITIGPRLSHIGLFDFHRADEAIEIGAHATERMLEDIDYAVKALSLTDTAK